MKALAVAAALSIAFGMNAVELKRGDVVRSSNTPAIMCPTPPRMAAYGPDLSFKSWIWTGDLVGFDSVGNLYTAEASTLQSFDVTLQPIRKVTLQENASALAVDAAGFAYVVGESGRVYVYSPGGVYQRGFWLPNSGSAPVRSADITPNGCTLMYIGDHHSMNRFDACAEVPLPPLAADEQFDAVRALNDGGFAGATSGHIKFYDSTGRVLYDIPAPSGNVVGALAFDADPANIWVATDETLARVHIADHFVGAHTYSMNPGGVAVFGEQRATAATLPAIPPPKRRSSRH
jgi:hypothetical protein